jgi:threonine/homoserine/homoserine lactone efflux protein
MIVHFLFGLMGSFLGGVAFGPINLSVVELTLKRDMRCANRFIIGAALMELFLAYLAILFGKLISRTIDEIPEFKLLVIAFFFILGLIFILKRDTVNSELPDSGNRSSFIKGLLVAILNPQTIPYWIFVLAYLKSSNAIQLQSWNFTLFLIGVCGGKYLILTLYSYLSEYIKNRFANIDLYVSKGIGTLLILVGLIQAINYFFYQ